MSSSKFLCPCQYLSFLVLSGFNETTSLVSMTLLGILYYVTEITFEYCFTMGIFHSGKNADFCSDEDCSQALGAGDTERVEHGTLCVTNLVSVQEGD